MSLPQFTHPDSTIPKLPESSTSVVRRPTKFDHFTFEPSSRWVRAIVPGERTCVVDSRHQLLVWEPNSGIPEYAFPLAHVRNDSLVPTTHPEAAKAYWRPKAEVTWFDLVLLHTTIPCAAWKYNRPELEDWISLSWHPATELAWYEEQEEVHTHPRDPHIRVDTVPTHRHIQAVMSGSVLADSADSVALFETTLPTRFYLSRADINWDLLEHVHRRTSCPYKGHCEDYWRLKGGDGSLVAWSYAEPMPQLSSIAGLVAFDSGNVQLLVDGKPFEGPEVWA